MKRLSISILIVLFSIFLGFLLLLASNQIPARLIEDKCRESAPFLSEAGVYPVEQYSGHKLDNFSDCVMLLVATYPGEEPSLDRTMSSYFLHVQEKSPYDSFVRIYSGRPNLEIETSEYARYWHGYLLSLRPLFTKLNYMQILQLNQCVQYTLLLLVLLLLYRKLPACLLPFLLTVLFLAPTTIGRSLHYSSVYSIMLLSSLLLLWNPGGKLTGESVWLLFLLAGIVTSFLDVLTAPTLTLTIPLCMLGVLLSRRGTARENLRILVRCGFFWFVGYAGMWAGKWLLSALLLGSDSLRTVLAKILVYTVSTEKRHFATPLASLRRNLTELFNNWDLNCLAILLAVLLVIAVLRSRRTLSRRDLADSLLLLLPALVPFVWIFVLKNHTHRHFFFTFRTMAPLIFSPLCALSVLASARPGRAAERSHRRAGAAD